MIRLTIPTSRGTLYVLIIKTKRIAGKDYIDFEFSKAFAMVEHQIAHVITKNGFNDETKKILNKTDTGKILDKTEQKQMRINHFRSGELILCADENSWFNYYWWNDVKDAPDFTFNVDIHRKPGYDPMELFLDHESKKISHYVSLIKISHGVFDNKNMYNFPIIASSIKTSKNNELLDITQIAPTMAKFFNINYEFPNKSLI